ncbi:MAG: hypothetical protein Mars2KO_36890 [Maribacter sp.]|uniref:DNA topoisomerase IV n=1 Tax=Maribacter sp. 2307UL18-2 TaxID=3386274 RepID=UPI0039BD35E4
MLKTLYLILLFVVLLGCYEPERNCSDFKNGAFSFTSIVDGKELKTTFTRNDNLEVDYFAGKADSSSVRWINDCEYIVKKLNPKSKAEEKPIHMKILSTTDNSYTFEYSIVGEAKKQRGTVTKTN